jgi:hypothetical protein
VLSAIVTVAFSEAMDSASINSSTLVVRIGATGPAITGTVSYNSQQQYAQFNPGPSGMPAATTIFVTAATGIKDRAGNPLAAPFTFSFTTTENTPPTVTSTNPANGATGVSPDLERYSITFSERMKPPISAAMFDMTRNSGLIVINAESYDPVTNTQHYLIRDKLQSLHRYEVQLEWTGPLTDVAGNRLTGEKSFTFTTLDAGPPLVVTTIPSKEATNVDPATFTAVFTPDAALASGTRYDVIVSNMKDATGVAMESNFVFFFVTR